ncbi:hypothetical protein LHP98_15010 [Rhodobacter sp. Har01]|uniref:hypothetical protein n=1 Tax=Rhodobacter sp. Har01 TaxID=2883999 RepID=UPI001D066301|nr:hypothetical protein [Rhodobacter sp. Har01]MCB6179430.1 hypothetical protein [Rhodobacter sp. Har01]
MNRPTALRPLAPILLALCLAACASGMPAKPVPMGADMSEVLEHGGGIIVQSP